MFPAGTRQRRRSRHQGMLANQERSLAAQGERSERPVAGTDAAAQPDKPGGRRSLWADLRGQNGAVHYHEAFWLIVGGAAPIVILAVVVSTRELQMVITLNAKLMFSHRFLERSYTRASLAYSFSLLIEVSLFLAAMYSLAVEKDVLPTAAAMWVAVAGICCAVVLPYLVFQLGVARRAAAELARTDNEASPEQAARLETANQVELNSPRRRSFGRVLWPLEMSCRLKVAMETLTSELIGFQESAQRLAEDADKTVAMLARLAWVLVALILVLVTLTIVLAVRG